MINQNEKTDGDTILLYPKSENGVMEQNPSKKTGELKKIFFLALLLGITITGMSQEPQTKFRLGGMAGLNISNFWGNYGAGTVEKKSTVGMRLGVVGEYRFNDWIAISPELVFTQKGMKMKASYGKMWYKSITRPCYLQIPINAVGRYVFKNDITVFGIVGPYFGFGLGGNLVYKDSEGEKEKEKIFSHDNAGLKRFDFGLTFGAGAEWKNIFLRFHYELGLVNINKYDEGSSSMRNSTFSISAGYYFLRK